VVRPLDMAHNLGVNLVPDDEVVAFFTVNRGLRAGDYGDELVRRCQRLVPHLRRAAQVQMRVAALEGQRVFALQALDRLRMGVVVVERRGRVVFLNTAAERMVAAADGLNVRRCELVAATSQETAELRRLVAQADGTAGRGRLRGGGEMTVTRPSGRRARVVIAVPVARSESAPGLRAPAAILFITDPEARHERSAAHIRREFGLTLGEAALVQRLLSGRGLKAAADELGITRNTAHTHLQRAFGKTGTRRQAELLQLVLSGLPDLLHPNG
jgi:DNA-binding CsgD family transcriptional regulator